MWEQKILRSDGGGGISFRRATSANQPTNKERTNVSEIRRGTDAEGWRDGSEEIRLQTIHYLLRHERHKYYHIHGSLHNASTLTAAEGGGYHVNSSAKGCCVL